MDFDGFEYMLFLVKVIILNFDFLRLVYVIYIFGSIGVLKGVCVI